MVQLHEVQITANGLLRFFVKFRNSPIKFVGGYYCGNKAITRKERIPALPTLLFHVESLLAESAPDILYNVPVHEKVYLCHSTVYSNESWIVSTCIPS